MSEIVPEGWAKLKLGNIGTFSTSSVDKKAKDDETSVSLLNYMDIYRNSVLSSSFPFQLVTAPAKQVTSSSVRNGDVFFTPSSETPDDIGHSAVFLGDADNLVHSYHTIRFRPGVDNHFDDNYKAYAFKGEETYEYFRKRATGSTRFTVSLPIFNELEVLIPPLPEQKKIASILTSVDEVIETTQKQIEKLQDLKKATMNELLTKGIGHTEFKDSELGRIPKSWEVKAISEIVSIPNGQVDPKIEPYASMPHIGSGNIISWTGQNKDVQTAFQAGQISGKYLFNANHILYSKVRPNLAKVCMPKFDGVCSADIYPLLPKEQISGKFIFQYLLTERFTQIATEVSERTGMPKINRQDLSVIKLPVPPFKEQLEIAKKIEAIDEAMSLKTKKLSQTQSLKKSLMQDLLTGKVRVQVN